MGPERALGLVFRRNTPYFTIKIEWKQRGNATKIANSPLKKGILRGKNNVKLKSSSEKTVKIEWKIDFSLKKVIFFIFVIDKDKNLVLDLVHSI